MIFGGMLFLLNSFSAMLPGLSYSEGGYPSGYTKQEYFRCDRKQFLALSIAFPIHHLILWLALAHRNSLRCNPHLGPKTFPDILAYMPTGGSIPDSRQKEHPVSSRCTQFEDIIILATLSITRRPRSYRFGMYPIYRIASST